MAEPVAERYNLAPAPPPIAESFAPAPMSDSVVDSQIIESAAVLEAPAPLVEPYIPTPAAEPIVDVPPQMQAIAPATEAFSPAPMAEPVSEHYIPAPTPEPIHLPVAESFALAPMSDSVVDSSSQIIASAPVLEAPAAEPIVDVAPVNEGDMPAREPRGPGPELISAPEPEPVVQAPTLDIVSDGVVEFIELIPLEIEELPYIDPERSA